MSTLVKLWVKRYGIGVGAVAFLIYLTGDLIDGYLKNATVKASEWAGRG